MRILLLLVASALAFGQTISKPGYSYFNQAHPLSQGLVSFVPLTEGIGAVVSPDTGQPTGFIRDVVQQGGMPIAYYKDVPTNGNPWVGSPFGWAINCSDTAGTGAHAQRLDYSGQIQSRSVAARNIPQLILDQVSVGVVMSPNSFTNSFGNIASKWVDDNADPFVIYGIFFDATSGKWIGAVSTGGAGTGSGPTSSTTLSVGTWYKLLMTYDKANVKIFQDGVQVGSTAKTGSISNTTGATFVTCGVPESLGVQTGDLKIAGVWIWNRPLNASEIGQWNADPWVMGRTPDEELLIAKFANANSAKPKTRVSFQ